MSNTKKRIVRLIAETEYSTCKVCGLTKAQAIYEFRHQKYVRGYTPPTLNPVCRKCVYKEVYGNKTFNKKMKERTLDDKT